MKICLWGLMISAFALMPLRTTPQAYGNSPPLIYYYAQDDAAFIIETATGDQREVLANFTLSEGTQIAGPGWSSSGEWFAWYERSQGAAPSNGYVVRRGLEDYITIFDSEGIIDMHWSPEGELLLASRTAYDEKANPQTEMVVIDFAMDQRVLLHDVYEGGLSSIGWLPQGQGVFFADTVGHVVITQNLDAPTPKVTSIEANSDYCAKISFSSVNYLLHQSADGTSLVVSNLSDSKVETVLQLDFDDRIQYVYWSHSGLQAVLYTTAFCSTNWTYDVWFLDMQAGTFVQLAEDVPALWGLRTTDSRFFYEPIWSPNDAYFAYLDTNRALQIVESNSLRSSSVDIAQDGDIERFWWLSEQEILFEWNVAQWYEDGIYIVSTTSWLDPAAHQIARVDIRYESTTQLPTLSSQSTKLAFSFPECNHGCILDLISGRIIETYQIEELQDVPYGASYFVWHSSDEWLFVLNDSDGISYLSIVDITGEVQRHLGLCTLSPSCFGWLPQSEGYS